MEPDKPDRASDVEGYKTLAESVFRSESEIMARDFLNRNPERRKKPRTRQRSLVPTPPRLDDYEQLVGKSELEQLRSLARGLRGRKVRMVGSAHLETDAGAVAGRIVPLLGELQIAADWQMMEVTGDFLHLARKLRLAGTKLTKQDQEIFLQHRKQRHTQGDEDIVVLHDPEALVFARTKAREEQRWVWRCHVNISDFHPETWAFLKPYVEEKDAAIFSAQAFASPVAIPQYLFYPCLDPLADRNKQLEASYIRQVCDRFGIDRSRPILAHVSQFDQPRDLHGIIQAYRLAKKYVDCQLIIAGRVPEGDPETSGVLAVTLEAAAGDADILVRGLPAISDREISAIQSASAIVVQNSQRASSSRTVTEALWKGKPVIGAAVGGIPNQIIHKITGLLVHSVEGCAYQIRYLLTHQSLAEQLGRNGREHVKENFLITSDLKRWLVLFQILLRNK